MILSSLNMRSLLVIFNNVPDKRTFQKSIFDWNLKIFRYDLAWFRSTMLTYLVHNMDSISICESNVSWTIPHFRHFFPENSQKEVSLFHCKSHHNTPNFDVRIEIWNHFVICYTLIDTLFNVWSFIKARSVNKCRAFDKNVQNIWFNLFSKGEILSIWNFYLATHSIVRMNWNTDTPRIVDFICYTEHFTCSHLYVMTIERGVNEGWFSPKKLLCDRNEKKKDYI